MAVVDGVLARLEPKAAARDAGQQRTALEAVEREIGNLAKAIAAGGQLEPLLVELRARQTRRDELLEAMAVYEGANVQRFDRNAIERKVRQRIDGWRALLTKHTSEGRQLLREVLAGPLRFTPEGRTYRFEGELAVGRLLAGMAGLTTTLVAVRGIEPRFDG
jgi:hypothetical protein